MIERRSAHQGVRNGHRVAGGSKEGGTVTVHRRANSIKAPCAGLHTFRNVGGLSAYTENRSRRLFK
jgi:hypothetical protein